ncbi:MAG: Holliday junction resolvase RecU [Tissierellia bacterium]|nr:Holliday junction resolvase RecU [Tissierellia bacterium]
MNELIRYKNRLNNNQGLLFEQGIIAACKYYNEKNLAKVIKVPEPFRVQKVNKDGTFKGIFIAKAEPDFIGTLANGTTIAFEAKYIMSDKIKQSVLTDTQLESLLKYKKLGAIAGVCVGIRDKHFFVPIDFFEKMKKYLGRKYATSEDLKKYEIIYKNGIMFLDYKE